MKVEFTVPQAAKMFFPPDIDALSIPTNIVSSSLDWVLGTQRVFPLLAIIWRRIFVAILCAFFFLNEASQAT